MEAYFGDQLLHFQVSFGLAYRFQEKCNFSEIQHPVSVLQFQSISENGRESIPDQTSWSYVCILRFWRLSSLLSCFFSPLTEIESQSALKQTYYDHTRSGYWLLICTVGESAVISAMRLERGQQAVQRGGCCWVSKRRFASRCARLVPRTQFFKNTAFRASAIVESDLVGLWLRIWPVRLQALVWNIILKRTYFTLFE